MVAMDSFEMSTYRLSTDCSSSELHGNGGDGKIRTYDSHRMKVVHYHFATSPYRNTLYAGLEPANFALYRAKLFPVNIGVYCAFECVFIW